MSLLPGGDPYIATLEVSAGFSWVLSVWFVAAAIAVNLRKNGAEHAAAGILWAFALSMLFEGVSFAISTLREYHVMNDPSVSARHDYILRTALWELSQCFSGGMGWVAALYLMMTKLAPRTIWMIGIGSGTVLGLLSASFILMDTADGTKLARLIFVVYFESMQAALGIATIRIYFHSKIEKATSGLLFMSIGGMLLLHVFQMSFTFGIITRTSWSLPIKLWLNCPVVLATAYALVKVSEHPAYDKVATATATEHRGRRLKDTVTFYAFPEYIWGLTLPILAAGYGLSALCLIYLTKPNMMHDPILAMYSTYHPCILLDYLPGTFMAQPLFDLSVVAYQATAVLAFVRTCLGGDLFSMMHVGFTTVLVLIFTTIFELVFTFNPSKTNALMHSVPFIGNQTSIALFMISQVFVVYNTVDPAISPKVKTFFVVYGIGFACLEFSGMVFMTKLLLLNTGYGNADGKLGIAMDPNVPIDNSDVVFNALPMTGAIIQIFNMLLYAIVCPLKFRPLICHVSARDASTGAPPPLAIDHELGACFHVKVSTRVFLRASSISMFLVGGMCYVLNKWVLGDAAIASFGVREHLRTEPGSALAAVGWMACAILFGLHVFVVCFYESMRNLNSLSVIGIEIAGAITFLTAFLMHADTIPGAAEQYPWFMGTETFLISLAVWVSVNISVCHFGHSMAKVSPKALLLDGIVGTALVVAIITSVGGRVVGSGHSLLADVAWVVLLFIFSFTDPRKCKLYINHIHVATNEEIVSKMDESFWGVPWFMCDIWGMKATLKSNRSTLL